MSKLLNELHELGYTDLTANGSGEIISGRVEVDVEKIPEEAIRDDDSVRVSRLDDKLEAVPEDLRKLVRESNSTINVLGASSKVVHIRIIS